MSTEKALVTAQKPGERAVDIIRKGYERIQKRDMDIVHAMNRFAELPSLEEDPTDAQVKLLLLMPEADLVAQGVWRSKKELRMAAYARLPRRSWPASMQAAHERVGMRLRKRNESDAPPVFNLNVITIPAPKAADERKVITIEQDPFEG